MIDLRSYAKAKEVYEEGQKEQDVNKRPKGPAIERVRDIYWEFQKERLAAKLAEQ